MGRMLSKEEFIKRAERKTRVDTLVRSLLFALTAVSASAVIFIVFFIVYKGLKPFISEYQIQGENYKVDFFSFLLGTAWQNGVAGYGAGYIIVNTIYVTALTMVLSGPISIMTALVIVRMSDKWIGEFLNSVIEILASIPSVIYGMFGMGIVTDWTKGLAKIFNYQSAGGLSNLTVVLVLTMMSIPTITMLSITSLKAVNKNLISASLALGASNSETNFKVVLASAKSGIFAGLILGVNRALGEATAVTMVCGNAGTGPTFNIFSTTRTLTSTMLTGMSDASGLNYDIRFSVGIILIFIIIGSNLLLKFANRKLSKAR